MDMLRKLADAKGPCVTIVEANGNAARLQEAVREVEAALPAPNRASLVASLRESMGRIDSDSKGTVVMLVSPELNEVRITGEELPSLHTVSEQFPLRALIPVFQQPHEFYLLALSRNRTRLLHCSATAAEEINLPKDTPLSLDDSKDTDTPDHLQDKMGTAGPGHGQMKGVMSGVSNDADRQPEYTHNFFRTIDRAVNAATRERALPLVLVGVESELAIYREVNTYSLLAPTGVLGSPDSFKGGEMHARGLRALSTFVAPATEKTLSEIDKLVGTGHASLHAADIVSAAHEGRIAHLFLQSSAEYLGTFDPDKNKTTHHASNGNDDRHNLMDDAARQTILHGGQVTVLTGRQMPNGVPVCAVYRY